MDQTSPVQAFQNEWTLGSRCKFVSRRQPGRKIKGQHAENQMFLSHLSMLGCDSRFMSWTSLSMLALLLARMFIFRAIT